jgi:hypothetical protein
MGKKMGIATNVAKRTAEGLITEEDITQLSARIRQMLANILARMPELNQSSPEEKAEIAEPLIDTLVSDLTQAASQKSEKQPGGEEEEAEEIQKAMTEEEILPEASGAAGGAGMGHMNGAWGSWDAGEKDEQKRTTTSRN